MKKLKVAVIGCGRISVMHLDSINEISNAELVACCDIKEDRAIAAAQKYGVHAYVSYQEMLQKEQLDVVHLCLPHYLHSQIACYCMEHGVNVLTEKPMDISLEAAEMAVETAKRTGKKFGVILQCRYNQSAQLVKKAVTSGKLGKILTASSVLTWTRPDSYYLESDWKGTWDKEGGGVIIDQAIHSIDLVNWIVDSPVESVSVSMANRGHNVVKVEDSADGLITYKNGVRYGFYCMNNYGDDEPIEIKLYCEKGKVVFGYTDAVIKYNDGTVEEVHDGHNIRIIQGAKSYWGHWHGSQISQFYDAVINDVQPEISGEEALRSHRLIMQLYDLGKMRP